MCRQTAICCRYSQDTFSPVHSYTSGVEFYLKRLRLTQDRSVTLQLWDVGGTSLTGGMLDKYLYGAHVSSRPGQRSHDWKGCVRAALRGTVLVRNSSPAIHSESKRKCQYWLYGCSRHFNWSYYGGVERQRFDRTRIHFVFYLFVFCLNLPAWCQLLWVQMFPFSSVHASQSNYSFYFLWQASLTK